MLKGELSDKELRTHEYFMLRCLQLAKSALGTAAPNPAVGCVIVHDNQIIGEGYTSSYGGPHAEVNAIAAVKNHSLLSSATLYVTLEPCTHFGKTPPCADLIIKNNVARVVIGLKDPFERVAGKGIERLQGAGCEVITGVLENACRFHHRRFLCFQEQKRPYVILKWAASIDGYMAPDEAFRDPEKKPYWISNKRAKQLVHKWRCEEQAILVGTNTVLKDNPKLNVRHWHGKAPIRIFLDKELKINSKFHLMDGQHKTIVFTQKELATKQHKNVIYDGIDFDSEIASQILSSLYRHNLLSVIIEGGAQTLNTFISSGLWDEARVLTAMQPLTKGLASPQLKNQVFKASAILDNQLKVYLND